MIPRHLSSDDGEFDYVALRMAGQQGTRLYRRQADIWSGVFTDGVLTREGIYLISQSCTASHKGRWSRRLSMCEDEEGLGTKREGQEEESQQGRVVRKWRALARERASRKSTLRVGT